MIAPMPQASPTDILSFAADLFAACQPEKRKRGGAPKGLMADRKIPHFKTIAALIIGYARAGEKVKINDTVQLSFPQQPKVTDTGLRLMLRTNTLLASAEEPDFPLSIPFPNQRPDVAKLCSGEWTVFGNIKARLDPSCLFPRVIQKGSGASIRWNVPPSLQYQGWLLNPKFTLAAIDIYENYGEFSLGGLPDWIAPRIV